MRFSENDDGINTGQAGEKVKVSPDGRDKSHYLQVTANQDPGPAHI